MRLDSRGKIIFYSAGTWRRWLLIGSSMENAMNRGKTMFAKIEITGVLETETGLHIGGSDAFAAIGAVDSPVIRDTRTNMPMIPGSR